MLAETDRLHVRFGGRSEDLRLGDLALDYEASDQALREALAKRYGCDPNALAGYVIVREPNAIIVRPVAVYG